MAGIPVPMFEPDRSPFIFRSGDNLVNCLPVVDGWGPMPSWNEVSDALPDECLGAIAITDADNTITIVAGTVDNLYVLNTSTSPYSWVERSKTTDVYSVPVGDRWSFTVFGDYLIAHNLGGTPQVLDLTGAGDFADLTGAPVAKHSWVAGDFLVFGWIDGAPNRIQWSALNDHTGWTVGRNFSDYQVFPDGGGVAGGIGGQGGAFVFFRDKIRRMNSNLSEQFVFAMQDVDTSRGAVAPFSIANIGNNDFCYLTHQGFYRGSQPIGAQRVDDWFMREIDMDFLFDVRAAVDPLNKIVWWRFQRSSGEGSLIGYDYQQDRWCYSKQDCQHATSMLSPGITLEGVSALFATAADMNVPFGSRIFAGGKPVFAVFTPDNKLAFATGQNKQAVIRTPQIELMEGGRTFVTGFRVETDATGITGRVGSSDFHGGEVDYTETLSPSPRGKMFRTRKSGRSHVFETTIAEGEVWSIITNIRPDVFGEGSL